MGHQDVPLDDGEYVIRRELSFDLGIQVYFVELDGRSIGVDIFLFFCFEKGGVGEQNQGWPRSSDDHSNISRLPVHFTVPGTAKQQYQMLHFRSATFG